MNEFRELGYRLFKEWSKAIQKFNQRPGAEDGPRIKQESSNRMSPTDGKPDILWMEAKLHRSGKVLAEATIEINYVLRTFDVIRPNHAVERFPSQKVDITGLVDWVITRLTGSQGHSR
jgi:hypothetical protein